MSRGHPGSVKPFCLAAAQLGKAGQQPYVFQLSLPSRGPSQFCRTLCQLQRTYLQFTTIGSLLHTELSGSTPFQLSVSYYLSAMSTAQV